MRKLLALAILCSSMATVVCSGCGSKDDSVSAAPPTGPTDVKKPAGNMQKSAGVQAPGVDAEAPKGGK